MITTRTRILSFLATVAMLVSMFACFVIPASAADEFKEPYQALLDDVGETAPNLKAAIDTAADADTLAAALQLDVAAGAIVWPEWSVGTVEFPRFAHHAVYTAAGYTTKEWSITEVADWTAMDDVAKAETADPMYIASDTRYFGGYTFHLTNNIDFNNVERLPLGARDKRLFSGTLNGHGYGFDNVNIKVAKANLSGTYYGNGEGAAGSMNGSIGLFGFLGNCTIQDFGINSGTITAGTANASGSASTFGCVYSTSTAKPKFIRVWSGATIAAPSTRHASALAGLLNAGLKDVVTVNGYVFDGTITPAVVEYGVYGFANKGPADDGTFHNIIVDPAGTSTTSFLFSYTSNDTFAAAKTNGQIKNVYGLSGIANSYRIGTSATANAGSDDSNMSTMSIEETAWTINKNPTNGEGETPVYFTLKDGKVRPVSSNENAIVKLILNVDDETQIIKYLNKGTELTKADLAGYVGVSEAAVIATVDEEAIAYPYALSDDTTIAITIDDNIVLNDTWSKYENAKFEDKYFTDESLAKLAEAKAEVEAARADSSLAESALETVEALEGVFVTYSTYPAEAGKAIPEYALVDTYGEFNKSKVWAIKEAKDWLAMVEASKVETFEGYTFHVLKDIDFEGKRMDPLNYDGTVKSQEMTNPFKGTIDGHGNAFKNIKIVFTGKGGKDSTPAASGDTYAGIIGSMAGGALIKDFGVDSGTITTSVKYMDLGTFGHVLQDQTATMQNVWSGVELSATGGSSSVSGIAAYPTGGKLTINGAYFFGSIAGVEGYSNCAIAGSNIRYCTGFYNTIGAPTTTPGHSVYWTNAAGIGLANNFAVGYDNVYGWKDGYAVEGLDNTNVRAATVEEAGYRVNKAQTDEQTFAKVYYTITEKGIRPTSDASVAIVKLTLTGDAAKEIYVNKGSELTAALLAEKLDVPAAAVTFEVAEGAVTEGVIGGDATINVSIDKSLVLKADWAEYYNTLDLKYLTISAEEWEAFNAAIAASTNENADALAAEMATLIEGLETYSTYPEAGGKEIPAYSLVDTYGAYNKAKAWTIRTAADWKKVIADADASKETVYFDGVTFHLTNDVEFKTTEWLTPAGKGANAGTADYAPKYFGGTINGHGFGFNEFKIFTSSNITPTDGTNAMEYAIGLFYRLGNCTFKDFGINSGWFNQFQGSGDYGASTFGGVVNGYAPTFERVWSDAWVIGGSSGYASALVSNATGNSYTEAISVNGFYFGGEVSNKGGKNVYMAIGAHADEIANGGSYQNVIADGHAFLTVNDDGVVSGTTVDASDPNSRPNVQKVQKGLTKSGDTYKDVYKTAAIFRFASAVPAVFNNIYGVKGTDEDTLRLDGPYAYAKEVQTDNAESPMLLETGLEAAWKINNAPTATNPVYFTLKGDKIRPVATNEKAIVKVTSTVGDEPAVIDYYNKGDVLSLTEDFDIAVVAGAEITVNGVAHTGDEITLTGDTEIVVTYNLTADATAALLPYEGLESKYFSNGAELEAMRALLVKEGVTNDELQTIIDWAATYVPVVWDADNYTKLPAYTEYAKYAAYNTANNWAIKAPADWLAMVADSKVDGANKTFKGYTFHVLTDIDFDATPDDDTSNVGIDMDPLNYGTTALLDDSTGPFQGTIEGYGNAFKNVNVNVEIPSAGESKSGYVTGLIGKLGRHARINNFGVDSGTIQATGDAIGIMVATFGEPLHTDAVEGTTSAQLNRVWSGATIISAGTGRYSKALGIAASGQYSEVVINGAYFYGTLSADPSGEDDIDAFAVYGDYLNAVNVYNSLGNPKTSAGTEIDGFAKRNKISQSIGFANNFGVNIPLCNIDVSEDTYIKNSGKVTSDLEGAYKINIAQNDEQTFAKVYYTITEDGIRPNGTADNAIVKVTLTGTKEGALYINKGTTITAADIAAAYGVPVEEVLKINGADPADVAITGDTTLNVELYVCDHATTKVVAVEGEQIHKIVCADCGEFIRNENCGGTWSAADDLANKVFKHTMTCTACNETYEEACDKYEAVPNAADCTAAGKYVFNCGVHTEYPAVETAKTAHTYEGEWTKDGDQEYRQCVNCTTKEYRNVCQHTEKVYTWVEGTETHKITCANTECGADLGTVDCGGAWVAGEVNMETGASEHTKTCPDCKKDYVEACQGKKETNPDDCTAAGKWTFDCELHEDVAIAPEYTAHDFSTPEWEPAEGAAGTKQATTCAHCSAKLYRYIGGVNAAGVELMADAAGNIVLTLPVALKSAKLTFTVPVGYTITAVEGATEGAGFYTVSNIEAGAPITITVDSVLTAVGGTFGVEVTEAIAADGAEVTNAVAQATIGFTAKNGDANGDKAVNLSDALAVLYKVVGQEGAADINVVNANVVDPATTDVNVNDVYEIVRIWLRETVFSL